MSSDVEPRTPSAARVAGWVGLALVVIGLAAFVRVHDWVKEGEDLAGWDQPVLAFLTGVRSPAVTVVLTAVTTVAGPVVLPLVVVAGCLFWGLRVRQWWSAALLAGAMVASSAASLLLKVVVARPRPPLGSQVVPGLETSYSFPSGHTLGAATFLLVLGYLAWVRRPTVRSAVRWAVVAAIGVGLVALSRLYLGYHFVTDVVASMALAVALLGAVVVIDRRWRPAR